MARQTSPPASFDPQARAIWSAAQHQLRAQGTWTRTDVPLLQMYVQSVRLAQRARLAADEYPLSRSSQNATQLCGHVELKIAQEAEASALKYATALLLTAESRKRHGITVPANSTSDL